MNRSNWVHHETGASPRRLLIATTNRHKWREIRELLAGVPLELLSLAEGPAIPPPDETGATFAENARTKALYYAAATRLTVVAEDSGLEIDALGGSPGVESARFGGIETPYNRKFAMIYEALRPLGQVESPARFVCALALADDQGVMFEAVGTVEGRVAPEPRGSDGFGYDPIFFYPPFNATLAEVAERKAEVSHRAQAFRALKAFLLDGFPSALMSRR